MSRVNALQDLVLSISGWIPRPNKSRHSSRCGDSISVRLCKPLLSRLSCDGLSQVLALSWNPFTSPCNKEFRSGKYQSKEHQKKNSYILSVSIAYVLTLDVFSPKSRNHTSRNHSTAIGEGRARPVFQLLSEIDGCLHRFSVTHNSKSCKLSSSDVRKRPNLTPQRLYKGRSVQAPATWPFSHT